MRLALARRQEQLGAGIDEAASTARAAADALAAEAQQHARVLIAMHLADPAASGVVHQPVRVDLPPAGSTRAGGTPVPGPAA